MLSSKKEMGQRKRICHYVEYIISGMKQKTWIDQKWSSTGRQESIHEGPCLAHEGSQRFTDSSVCQSVTQGPPADLGNPVKKCWVSNLTAVVQKGNSSQSESDSYRELRHLHFNRFSRWPYRLWGALEAF